MASICDHLGLMRANGGFGSEWQMGLVPPAAHRTAAAAARTPSCIRKRERDGALLWLIVRSAEPQESHSIATWPIRRCCMRAIISQIEFWLPQQPRRARHHLFFRSRWAPSTFISFYWVSQRERAHQLLSHLTFLEKSFLPLSILLVCWWPSETQQDVATPAHPRLIIW